MSPLLGCDLNISDCRTTGQASRLLNGQIIWIDYNYMIRMVWDRLIIPNTAEISPWNPRLINIYSYATIESISYPSQGRLFPFFPEYGPKV